MKTLLLALIACAALPAWYDHAMTVQTIADITPNGTATPLVIGAGSANLHASWVIFTATGTSMRVGDANVGASRGVLLPAGVPVLFPRGDFDQGGYWLSKIYLYGASGSDKAAITYAD